MHTPSPRFLLAPLALLSLGATSTCGGPDLLDDAHFDLWCGESLCAWELEEGSLEQVSTWHERDFGASLVGSPAAISQLSQATSDTVDCIEFRLSADTDPDAALYLELDYLDDGVIDYDHVISSDGWSALSFTITPPTWFEGMRFRIRKRGEGFAAVAQLRAIEVLAEDCLDEPMPLLERPQYAVCEEDEECADGACGEIPVHTWGARLSATTCGECEADTDCATDQVCGVSWDPEETHGARTCEAPATKALAETCATDGECSSGVCAEGQCAECRVDGDCAQGSCLQHPNDDNDFAAAMQPLVCWTGPATREAEAACLADGDCLSGDCAATAEVGICDLDGRPCDADADCPGYEGGEQCYVLAARDGTCS